MTTEAFDKLQHLYLLPDQITTCRYTQCTAFDLTCKHDDVEIFGVFSFAPSRCVHLCSGKVRVSSACTRAFLEPKTTAFH